MPGVCTNSVSIHQVWSRRHQERDRHAIYCYTTIPSSSDVISISGEFQSYPCCHTCVPHAYHYFYASPLPIRIANCWEYLYLFIITVLIKFNYSINNIIIIPHPCLGFIFKTIRKSLELFGNISRSRCIKIHSNTIHLHSSYKRLGDFRKISRSIGPQTLFASISKSFEAYKFFPQILVLQNSLKSTFLPSQIFAIFWKFSPNISTTRIPLFNFLLATPPPHDRTLA
jgi:hypothetical protein